METATRPPVEPDEADEADEADAKQLERITLFSDAVIAIAITLLALDIRLPDVPLDGSVALRDALFALAPHYFAYALSFLVVGSFWIGHTIKFRHIVRYDVGLMWINLIFLMVIGFVPFASSVLSAHENLTSYTLYDGTMIAAALLSAAIWAYAVKGNRLVDPDLDRRARRDSLIGPLKVALVFALSLLFAYVAPRAERWAFLLLLPAVVQRRRAVQPETAA